MEFYTKVAGVTFEGRQRVIRNLYRNGKLNVGAPLILQRDRYNAFDRNAVAVLSSDNQQIGFLPKEVATNVAKFWDTGTHYSAYVTAVTGGDVGMNYGVNIRVEYSNAVKQDSIKVERPQEDTAGIERMQQLRSKEERDRQETVSILQEKIMQKIDTERAKEKCIKIETEIEEKKRILNEQETHAAELHNYVTKMKNTWEVVRKDIESMNREMEELSFFKINKKKELSARIQSQKQNFDKMNSEIQRVEKAYQDQVTKTTADKARFEKEKNLLEQELLLVTSKVRWQRTHRILPERDKLLAGEVWGTPFYDTYYCCPFCSQNMVKTVFVPGNEYHLRLEDGAEIGIKRVFTCQKCFYYCTAAGDGKLSDGELWEYKYSSYNTYMQEFNAMCKIGTTEGRSDGGYVTYKEPVSLPLKSIVGLTIEFGRYRTGNVIENLKWRIIDAKKELVLISEKAIDARQYNDTKHANLSWENCQLREWLNNDFFREAFAEDERRIIVETETPAHANPVFDINPGKDTRDRVFLLSLVEARQYFSTNAERKCIPTQYAIKQGGYVDEDTKCCWWWLRSHGSCGTGAAVVQDNGAINLDGHGVRNSDACVRPVITIALD